MILISAQYGDPKSSDLIWPYHKRLNDVFAQKNTSTYFQTIEILSVIFRVSGKIWKFEGEGPERLKYLKKAKAVTVDLLIPERKWRDVSNDELVKYISNGVRECFELLLGRAKKAKELIDEDAIRNDFDRLIKEFEDMSISINNRSK